MYLYNYKNNYTISITKNIMYSYKYFNIYSDQLQMFIFLFNYFFILDIIKLALFSSLKSFNNFAFDSSNHF